MYKQFIINWTPIDYQLTTNISPMYHQFCAMHASLQNMSQPSNCASNCCNIISDFDLASENKLADFSPWISGTPSSPKLWLHNSGNVAADQHKFTQTCRCDYVPLILLSSLSLHVTPSQRSPAKTIYTWPCPARARRSFRLLLQRMSWGVFSKLSPPAPHLNKLLIELLIFIWFCVHGHNDFY